jgi:hypothetical protein
MIFREKGQAMRLTGILKKFKRANPSIQLWIELESGEKVMRAKTALLFVDWLVRSTQAKKVCRTFAESVDDEY